MTEAEPRRGFRPKNESQRQAMKVLAEHEISFLLGPAGTAKSHCATAFAVMEVEAKRYDKFVIVRPAIEVEGEDLGYLPGEIKDKIRHKLVQQVDEALEGFLYGGG